MAVLGCDVYAVRIEGEGIRPPLHGSIIYQLQLLTSEQSSSITAPFVRIHLLGILCGLQSRRDCSRSLVTKSTRLSGPEHRRFVITPCEDRLGWDM